MVWKGAPRDALCRCRFVIWPHQDRVHALSKSGQKVTVRLWVVPGQYRKMCLSSGHVQPLCLRVRPRPNGQAQWAQPIGWGPMGPPNGPVSGPHSPQLAEPAWDNPGTLHCASKLTTQGLCIAPPSCRPNRPCPLGPNQWAWLGTFSRKAGRPLGRTCANADHRTQLSSYCPGTTQRRGLTGQALWEIT